MSEKWESMAARELLAAAIAAFHPRIALSTAFGVEGVVIVDILMRIEPRARIFTVDTGRLPPETYALIDAVRARYGCTIDVFFPMAQAVEAMVGNHGVNLFYASVERRKQCCAVRKVEPLGRALAGLQAWITGLRRDQAVTRRDVAKVQVDRDHGGILKLNPLADWSTEDVWRYVRAHDVPYNALHDQGYPSIGCAPCTRAVRPGEDLRAGRWWWEAPESKECGLHLPTAREASS
ncbi:MAG: phosphoadenylyl-sulfate reductase [Candidatus Rokuibacteriota bacterium]|nr:MAG: phosphoadenylyl-sulfate reductase [Candidatus Rokubacteria bacterium]